MNLQQLKYVRAAVLNNLNLTEVASTLFTSQSGVSKQIKELEAELGIEIFVRRGKRLVGVTQAGERVVQVVNNLMAEADNLKRLSQQFTQENGGRLVLAVTHNQARYVLPPILSRFVRVYPDVEIELRQGAPKEVADLVERGEADIGIATEAVAASPKLETHACFTWRHLVVAPVHHPLMRLADAGLKDIAAYPIVTYNAGYSARANIDAAFASAGLRPDIRLTAPDADVIGDYVQLGLGVGVVAEMVAGAPREGLAVVPGSEQLFGASATRVAFLRGALLRDYAYRFIEALAPHLDAEVLKGGRRRPPSSARPQAVLPYGAWRELHAPPGLALVSGG